MSECFIRNRSRVLDKPGPPEFTYTGQYTLLDDGNNNWRLKFLTSGTLTISRLNGAKQGIDVFLVGGGGGGRTNGGAGGAGYTKTTKGVSVAKDSPYSIVIGAGGSATGSGGTSQAFGASASGGAGGGTSNGGAGGSGGGHISYYGETDKPQGGSNGGNGGSGARGQGTTTREFGEASGALYAGGGSAASGYDVGGGAYSWKNIPGGDGGGGACYGSSNPQPGAVNTGGGGAGARYSAAAGGSGIVIIRNAR